MACDCCTKGCCCFECISQSEYGFVERCGEFDRVVAAGASVVCWPFEVVAGRVSLRIQQLDVACETKTSDNVFVNVVISVQYRVIPEQTYNAYYKLADPRTQIESYVFDVIRSALPKMELDESFSSKDTLANKVKEELDATMADYGYHIEKALVTDISPDARVKMSMNEINASRRLREAAKEKAEADKITQVKAAEADAESKYLSGVGVARQRQAIVGGLQDSIIEFSGEIAGTTPKDVMDLLLLTQYFDMLKDVGASGVSGKTLFLPHAPSSVAELQKSMQSGLMENLK
mmetsp:Transcript_21644/g.69965  ORF Transcript_21644/g.69965 Transcript_21644/m.69965 type:complete len:290 (+) Transcript_21644:128-997(+)